MIRQLLKNLENLLHTSDELVYAKRVHEARTSEDDDILFDFLISNDLWGGMGSIADQAGMDYNEQKKEFAQTLVKIGEYQISLGKTNIRTASWVDVYKNWLKNGVNNL